MKNKRILKVKNIMIFYNIITILKFVIFSSNILYIDFMIDFVFLNISLVAILNIHNYITLN